LDTTNNQRILGYFIEEAKEHLKTIERGILELSSVVADSERINEVFRAAHSIKGGAAMLGYGSIQKTAHRLEDSFKILRENPMTVDQKLESFFLAGYDILQNLIEHLQGPFGLQNEEAEAIVAAGEPNFVELQSYLKQLLGDKVKVTIPGIAQPPQVPLDRRSQVTQLLKKMLQLFKERVTPENRLQLEQLCSQLAQLYPQEKRWQTLTQVAASAIANPKHPYTTLAPVILKELKQSSDLIELDRGDSVVPSQGLQQLATAKFPLILISLEPKSAANTLLQVFNKQQIAQLVQLLQSSQN
jgi:chemotaxis protein histidine kinase CheA